MSAGCSDDTPPIDSNCADPAYRAAHPDECRNYTLLILTPEQGLIQVGGTLQYTVVLRANGVETVLEQGLSWESSNSGVAQVNDDGLATGASAGQTNIAVAWQNLTAQAQLDVVANCEETNQFFRILIDNSKSMGQSFSGAYGTKLQFSKSIARDFCDTVNFSKDQAAVSVFNDDYEQVQTWSQDAEELQSAISTISISTGGTNLADALSEAIEGFEGQDGVRVIVLFTDGQWIGDDPKPIAQAFRESGGFICVVATRAWNRTSPESNWFSDLFAIASSGFLLSAYEDVQGDILGWLSGLKSFLCSGGCSPEPGTAPMAQLNYTGWNQFNASRVIRDSEGEEIEEIFPDDPRNPLDDSGRPASFPDYVGFGLFDVRPEHGGYVDLQGTGPSGHGQTGLDLGFGRLTTKEDFQWENGKDYSITLLQAGSTNLNPINPPTTPSYQIRITCGDNVFEPDPIFGSQDFEETSFEWTQDGDFEGPIIIEQIAIRTQFNIGTLIDDIVCRNETDDEVIFEEDFDSENLTTIDPSTGGYAYGCLDVPIGPQSADPSPPPFLEE